MLTFQTAEEIPEAFRPHYVEQNGVWRSQSDIDLELSEGKRNTAIAEKKDALRVKKEAEEKLALRERTDEARAKGISDEELQKIRDAEALNRKPIEEALAAAQAEVRQLKLTDKVEVLSIAAGVMEDRRKVFLREIASRVDLTDALTIVVKDKDGNVTTETIEAALAKGGSLYNENQWAFSGTPASGSGGNPSNTSPTMQRSFDTNAHRNRVAGAF